jgi:hypothetical protein
MDVPVHSLPLEAFAVVLRKVRTGVAGSNEFVTKLSLGERTLHTQFLRRNALGRADGCDQSEIGEALVPSPKHHG